MLVCILYIIYFTACINGWGTTERDAMIYRTCPCCRKEYLVGPAPPRPRPVEMMYPTPISYVLIRHHQHQMAADDVPEEVQETRLRNIYAELREIYTFVNRPAVRP